jgi:integrase
MKWKPKSKAGTRTIPLPDSLIADLKAARQKKGLVFPTPKGKVDYHKLRMIQAVAEKAGVEGAGLHKCRDTFATEALRAGVDLLTVARWLGHRGLGTVKLYAESLQAKDARARDAVNRMDNRYSAVA